MDRTKLMELLRPFQNRCDELGKPLQHIFLKEAYLGDISTSYIVEVKADWIEGMSCYDALDFLFDVLWETTSEDTRKKIFSIKVLDSVENLQYLPQE